MLCLPVFLALEIYLTYMTDRQIGSWIYDTALVHNAPCSKTNSVTLAIMGDLHNRAKAYQHKQKISTQITNKKIGKFKYHARQSM